MPVSKEYVDSLLFLSKQGWQVRSDRIHAVEAAEDSLAAKAALRRVPPIATKGPDESGHYKPAILVARGRTAPALFGLALGKGPSSPTLPNRRRNELLPLQRMADCLRQIGDHAWLHDVAQGAGGQGIVCVISVIMHG